MAVPRNRVSNSHKNLRRSHHAKRPKNFIRCTNCENRKLRHEVCPRCGQYAGRVVFGESAE